LPDVTTVADLRKIPHSLRGLDLLNPMNCTRVPGVQLELPPGVRGSDDPTAPRGAPAVPDPRLLHALACTIVELDKLQCETRPSRGHRPVKR
jgi:hypothetical protein